MVPLQVRWIEAFRAVVTTGSTMAAAELLAVDQSAVSRHIVALESRLGIQLFDRSQRNLVPTPEGQILLEDADNVLEAMERLKRKAGELGRLASGHLRILTSATLARGLLPMVTARFRLLAPGVSVVVDIAARGDLQSKVDSQQFDLCAIALPFPYPEDGVLRLGRFAAVCIAPRQHPLAKMRSIELKDLAEEQIVSLPLGTVGRVRIEEIFGRAGIAYKPAVETTAVALNEFVAAGLGVAITDPFTAGSVAADRIVTRTLSPSLYYEYGVLFPVKRPRSRVAVAFADVLIAEATKIAVPASPD